MFSTHLLMLLDYHHWWLGADQRVLCFEAVNLWGIGNLSILIFSQVSSLNSVRQSKTALKNSGVLSDRSSHGTSVVEPPGVSQHLRSQLYWCQFANGRPTTRSQSQAHMEDGVMEMFLAVLTRGTSVMLSYVELCWLERSPKHLTESILGPICLMALTLQKLLADMVRWGRHGWLPTRRYHSVAGHSNCGAILSVPELVHEKMWRKHLVFDF